MASQRVASFLFVLFLVIMELQEAMPVPQVNTTIPIPTIAPHPPKDASPPPTRVYGTITSIPQHLRRHGSGSTTPAAAPGSTTPLGSSIHFPHFMIIVIIIVVMGIVILLVWLYHHRCHTTITQFEDLELQPLHWKCA